MKTQREKEKKRERQREKERQNVPLRYVPRSLSRKDTQKQAAMLRKSRRLYKQGKYVSRDKLPSFRSKKSRHVLNAERIYGINNMQINDILAKKTGCSKNALQKIVNKGEGAYFSSGSRPNQTAQSWGYARLASALTSGKAAVIDYSILEQGCKPMSRALKMAKHAKTMKKRRVPHVPI
jgi:hypothetical protein